MVVSYSFSRVFFPSTLHQWCEKCPRREVFCSILQTYIRYLQYGSLDSGKKTEVTKRKSWPLRCFESAVGETDVYMLDKHSVLPSPQESGPLGGAHLSLPLGSGQPCLCLVLGSWALRPPEGCSSCWALSSKGNPTWGLPSLLGSEGHRTSRCPSVPQAKASVWCLRGGCDLPRPLSPRRAEVTCADWGYLCWFSSFLKEVQTSLVRNQKILSPRRLCPWRPPERPERGFQVGTQPLPVTWCGAFQEPPSLWQALVLDPQQCSEARMWEGYCQRKNMGK